MINIKPFTEFDEHDILNLFALNSTSGDRGSFVKIVGSGWLNTNTALGFAGAGLPGNPAGLTDYVSPLWENRNQVKLAASGERAFGVILNSVRLNSQFGEYYIYDKQRALDNQIVTSGKTIPIARKGLFLVSGVVGVVGVGSGAKAGDAGNGNWQVCATSDTACVGEFIGSQDPQGFALFSLNCY